MEIFLSVLFVRIYLPLYREDRTVKRAGNRVKVDLNLSHLLQGLSHEVCNRTVRLYRCILSLSFWIVRSLCCCFFFTYKTAKMPKKTVFT